MQGLRGAAGWLPCMLPIATPRELEALRVGAAGSPVPPGPVSCSLCARVPARQDPKRKCDCPGLWTSARDPWPPPRGSGLPPAQQEDVGDGGQRGVAGGGGGSGGRQGWGRPLADAAERGAGPAGRWPARTRLRGWGPGLRVPLGGLSAGPTELPHRGHAEPRPRWAQVGQDRAVRGGQKRRRRETTRPRRRPPAGLSLGRRVPQKRPCPAHGRRPPPAPRGSTSEAPRAPTVAAPS